MPVIKKTIDPFIEPNPSSSHFLTPYKITLYAIITETADLINENDRHLNEYAERCYFLLLCKLVECSDMSYDELMTRIIGSLICLDSISLPECSIQRRLKKFIGRGMSGLMNLFDNSIEVFNMPKMDEIRFDNRCIMNLFARKMICHFEQLHLDSVILLAKHVQKYYDDSPIKGSDVEKDQYYEDSNLSPENSDDSDEDIVIIDDPFYPQLPYTDVGAPTLPQCTQLAGIAEVSISHRGDGGVATSPSRQMDTTDGGVDLISLSGTSTGAEGRRDIDVIAEEEVTPPTANTCDSGSMMMILSYFDTVRTQVKPARLVSSREQEEDVDMSHDVPISPASSVGEKFKSKEYALSRRKKNLTMQGETLIVEQIDLIENNTYEAMSPRELQRQINHLLKIQPSCYRAHYLAYLNNVRIREYSTAQNCLVRYFDLRFHDRSSQVNRSHCNEALASAVLQAQFGHAEEASFSVNEAMIIARNNNDTNAILHCLGWFETINKMNNIKDSYHILTYITDKAEQLKMEKLKIFSLLSLASFYAENGGPPSKIFAAVKEYDHSMSSSLWQQYGYSEQSLIKAFVQLDQSSSKDDFSVKDMQVICNIAKYMYFMGDYHLAIEVLEANKHHLNSIVGDCCDIWRMTYSLIKLNRCMLVCDWPKAKVEMLKLKSVDNDFGILCFCEILMEQGNYTEVEQILTTINVNSHTLHIKKLLLLAELSLCTGDQCLALHYAISAEHLAYNTNFTSFLVTSRLMIARIQLDLKLHIRCMLTLDHVKMLAIRIGHCLELGKLQFMYARSAINKIKLSKLTKQRKNAEYELCLSHLIEAETLYKRISAVAYLKDLYYVKAGVYHELNDTKQRNKASSDIFLEKHWKSVIHRSICDYFFEAQNHSSTCTDVVPVITTPHHYLINIFRGGIFMIAVVMTEVPPLFIIEFLHRIYDTFEDYFSECSETTIKDNVVTVYELLDEMLDNGFPLCVELNILKEMIRPPNLLRSITDTVTGKSTSVSDTLPTGQLSNMPWRRSAVKYTNNEAYFDIIEEIDVIIDKWGSTVSSEIQGCIDCMVKLSGMPDLTLSFNNVRLLDDISFHPCVRFKRWENEKILSFIPPDGNFRLISYHINNSSVMSLPVYLKHNISFKDKYGKLDITIGPRQTNGKIVENVAIDVPFSKSVLNMTLNVTQGKYTFDPVTKVMTWEVGRIDISKLPNIKGTITLQSGAPMPDSNPIISVKFRINTLATSGLKVNRLDMYGEKYKPFKGVKYITKSGKYHIRT